MPKKKLVISVSASILVAASIALFTHSQPFDEMNPRDKVDITFITTESANRA